MTIQGQAKVLVDTCVLLDDPNVLVRIRQKNGLAFLTSTVLDELDFNKSGSASINMNARMIFREFNRVPPSKLPAMPTGEALHEEDLLTQFPFKGGPVYLVARDEFRARSNNDAKIIELAKDYKMVLITRDNGMKVRAEALGVDVAFWTGPGESTSSQREPKARPLPSTEPRKQPAGVKPSSPDMFAVCTAPINEEDTPILVGSIPGSGESAKLSTGHEFRLGKLISAGGEGSIYETELAGQVCKIYHRNRLTKLKQKKIQLMVSRRIDRPGICWPTEVVTNGAGEFIGYLMPRATGFTMQSAMFVKPKLEKTFPKWTRRDLVNVAGTFIDHIYFLHSLNIIVGDINPMNLLVTKDSTTVWMVDTDSFQIENFPCPVGTVNFTPTEIQGKNYAEFLRTVDQELFAVATMIFMILFPGKPPYSQQGGGSPAENIKSKNFPYRYFKESGKENPEVSGKTAPQGTWQFIWANLPNAIREAFFNTFREDKRTGVDEWTSLLVNYRSRLERGTLPDEMFPLEFQVKDPIQVPCAKCSGSFTASQRRVEKMMAECKSVWCPECANRVRVENLARQSKRTTEQFTGQETGYGNTARPGTGWNATRPTRQPRPTTQASARSGYKSSSSAQTSSGLGNLIGDLFRAIFK
jgi:serine/threonine protein kinase